MKVFKLLMISMLVFSFIGCGDDKDDDKKEAVTFDMGEKTTYQVPENVDLVDAKIEGTEAQMMSSGEDEELAAFVVQQACASTKSSTKSTYKSIQKGIESVFSQLSNSNGSIDTLSLLSSQNFQTPYDFTIASYNVKTNKEIEPLTLAGEILNVIASGNVKGLPVAATNAPVDTEFRLILLYGEYEKCTFYIAVVVPEKLYSQYQTQGNDITKASRVYPQGKKLTSSSEKFNQAKGKQKADFLFVVDDSGSMSDDQDALSQAADDFSAEMASSGLTYRAAIITTGYGATDPVNGAAYSILRRVGIIENNDTLLKQALVAGTNGSITETGIWNAEQSLQSLAYNDNFDGAVTLAGMPESGTNLSVIIISDEDSQYQSRSGGREFNVSKNLFIDRNIIVHSIIQPAYSFATTGIFDEYNYSQYDDLALITHGRISDIRNRDANGSLSFKSIMQNIASDAGGAASSFVLAHSAVVISEVKVNGTVISEDSTNGYTYVQGTQSIVFHGTSIPASGATIEVSYDYYQ
jgi:hypothetical protein